MSNDINTKRDELARQSVNRDMLELSEADARERHYKLGWDACKLEMEKNIADLEAANKRLTAKLNHYLNSEECWDKQRADAMPYQENQDLKDKLSEMEKTHVPIEDVKELVEALDILSNHKKSPQHHSFTEGIARKALESFRTKHKEKLNG